MNTKLDESLLIAYLYDELSGEEKTEVEKYLAANPEAAEQLHQMRGIRSSLQTIQDKEVIAPPIVLEEGRHRFLFDTPYFKTILGIAASLLVIMIAAKVLDLRINLNDNSVLIGFGEMKTNPDPQVINTGLSEQQVQGMIQNALAENNEVVQASLDDTQKRFQESIRKNMSNGNLDGLIQKASAASRDQIRQYAFTMQAENEKLMKDYMQLTAAEQKQYIEDLLVDFAKYLQQQRVDDLQLMQTRLTSIEQNTNIFKQETEQILTSIISTVGNTETPTIKN